MTNARTRVFFYLLYGEMGDCGGSLLSVMALVEAGDAEADDGAAVTDDDAAGIGCGNGV